MKNINEEVLEAWLRLTTVISNAKIVSDMPYNEALICNFLYNNQLQSPEHPLTATDLCRQTKMLKSQMNRTLQSMENKQLITRKRSDSDKRQVFIFLNTKSEAYKKQHEKSLQIINSLADKIGAEKTKDIASLFNTIADLAQETIK